MSKKSHHAGQTLDETQELQPITIRLPKELIKTYKMIATFHGVGHQPMIRDVLQRYVDLELQHVLDQQLQSPEYSPRPELTAPSRVA